MFGNRQTLASSGDKRDLQRYRMLNHNEKVTTMQDLNMPKSGWVWLGGGAVFFAILFTHGTLWFTPGAADKVGKQAADAAVATALAPFCVERFQRANNASVNLAALKKAPSEYDQETFITNGGWATLPGSDSPKSGVARRCGQILVSS
jgi:hypothetical protein